MSHDELIDIIDEDNNVIGQVGKYQAHQEGLLHRTIIAELIDSKGKWTLVKQADDRQDAGQYVSPVGGHIRAGESEESALIRESIEEIGIKPVEYKRVGTAIYDRQVIGRHENHLFIVYEIYSDQVPVLNHESVSFKKFTLSELSTQLRSQPDLFGDAFHFVLDALYSEILP